MKIVVCIKQVPDTTEIKLDPATGTMIRDGVPSIMNPDDKGGLEMALQLKDKYGAEVTVITMGPPQADDILREAFAMGADRAIHLNDRKFAENLEFDGSRTFTIRKSTEDGFQLVQVDAPCVVTVLATANKARYMSVRGIVEAYNKEVEVWGFEHISVEEEKLGLKGSPTRVWKSFTKGAKAAGKVFEVEPAEAADIIVEKLKEKFII